MDAKKLTVLAIAAHPDDIEFVMAGTLLLLKDKGADIHMWNLSRGGCGSATYTYDQIVAMRWQEAQDSARLAGATMHPPIAEDLEIMYDKALLARVTAVVRQIKPDIVLTHSPQDYMEDHMNTARLAVTGVFARGIPNYACNPPTAPVAGNTVVYHAMPHGLMDSLRTKIRPGLYANIGAVLARKREMLAQHRSQKEWLDVSQGMDSYLLEMEKFNREVGSLSGRFEVAEGWRRHSYMGFGGPDDDPLRDALGDFGWIDPAYEASLEA